MPEPLLPLFPLSVVLLPSTPLPLHIFEERYKEMMEMLIPAQTEFGVVLARDGGVVNIGCTATIERVVQRYPDGKLDLLTRGRRRFRIISLDDEKDYLRAVVEYFNDDEAGDVPPVLRQRAIDAYRALRAIEPGGVTFEPRLEDPQVSFQLAQFIDDLDQRQTLLAIRSEVERLERLVEFLPEYVARREKILVARQLAPRNGHAKHFKDQG